MSEPANPRGFASDNYAGIHPEVLAAIEAANDGHVIAYGDDPYTERLSALFREHFGEQANAFPVFNGTGANVSAIDALTSGQQAVICTATAHLHVDECGAPERIAGAKLYPIDTRHGKLTPELIEAGLEWREGDEHAAQPRIVSITNSTELGTVYTAAEVQALADYAHGRGMLLHTDGARISNATAALGCELREISTDAGVDVLSFGGTKNGTLGAEAVVFLGEGLGENFKFVRKQLMQLASKMRFFSVQLEALLTDELWRRNALQSNAIAKQLEEAIRPIEGVEIVHPVEANAVFASIPQAAIDALLGDAEGNPFYVWEQATRTIRLMCCWDNQPEDVEAFAARLSEVVAVPA